MCLPTDACFPDALTLLWMFYSPFIASIWQSPSAIKLNKIFLFFSEPNPQFQYVYINAYIISSEFPKTKPICLDLGYVICTCCFFSPYMLLFFLRTCLTWHCLLFIRSKCLLALFTAILIIVALSSPCFQQDRRVSFRCGNGYLCNWPFPSLPHILPPSPHLPTCESNTYSMVSQHLIISMIPTSTFFDFVNLVSLLLVTF